MVAHRLENVLKVPLSVRCIIRTAYFSHTELAGLLSAFERMKPNPVSSSWMRVGAWKVVIDLALVGALMPTWNRNRRVDPVKGRRVDIFSEVVVGQY